MNNLPIVCIVEDNPDDERLTIRALRKGKIANEIKVARNGEEALNMVLNANPLPCVVLLDLKLPKIDESFFTFVLGTKGFHISYSTLQSLSIV